PIRLSRMRWSQNSDLRGFECEAPEEFQRQLQRAAARWIVVHQKQARVLVCSSSQSLLFPRGQAILRTNAEPGDSRPASRLQILRHQWRKVGAGRAQA